MSGTPALTQLLQSWQRGDGAAFAELFQLAYDELKQIAAQRLRPAGRDLTLTPTVLLHEAYLRVAGKQLDWGNRAHFFASMSLYIRSALLDHARARHAAKHGSSELRISLSDVAGEELMVADVLAPDQALTRLASLDPRSAEVLHLTHFARLDREQISLVLGVSLSSVDRALRFARAWLRDELAAG